MSNDAQTQTQQLTFADVMDTWEEEAQAKNVLGLLIQDECIDIEPLRTIGCMVMYAVCDDVNEYATLDTRSGELHMLKVVGDVTKLQAIYLAGEFAIIGA